MLLLLVCGLPAAATFAVDYEKERSAAIKSCEAIDPSESRSGLFFNPDGYQSYYVRSKCFQDAAKRYRDDRLCQEVKRRWSLFSSSWGYSASQCGKFVAEGKAADRRALQVMKAAYLQGGIKVRDFRVERNGNGRDFDIIPGFTGDYAHGYTLAFEILQPDASTASIAIHSDGYHLDANSNLSIYVRQADVRQRYPRFALNRPYVVRTTVTLDVGSGGQSARWSDAFIASVFPLHERSHSVSKSVVF